MHRPPSWPKAVTVYYYSSVPWSPHACSLCVESFLPEIVVQVDGRKLRQLLKLR